MSIYYKYAPYGSIVFVLSYVDDCVYWYNSEYLGKWFVDTLGKIFHVNFLGYVHWFMSIRIYQMRDRSISVDQDRYATSIVVKYLDTATVKASKKFYKTTLPSGMIITKADASTSDEKVVNVELTSQLLNLLITGGRIRFGEYRIRWQSIFVKNRTSLNCVSIQNNLKIEVAYIA